ncbi:hypothetical protein Acr_24g0004660 [Actinidia rufa]|uniref:Uncharacterized protein n=1 Tax=Actinidia rufa TaxID=165716 RepID=A0A7J0GU14_9ERIC|nr:hypothetical protein Acr_24g0004660 [Actinidia rufa]
MDTSSLTKEGNVMTPGRTGTSSDPPIHSPQGYDSGFLGMARQFCQLAKARWRFTKRFSGRLKASPPPTIREILIHYKICPAQLSPNCVAISHLFAGDLASLSSARPEELAPRIAEQRERVEKRFFFASRDEWEFPSGTPPAKLCESQIWGTPAATKLPSCPRLNARGRRRPREDRARRLLRGFEGPGFTDVQQILCDWRARRSLPAAGQHDLGDEGEFVTREDSVEYLGVKDPFTNLLSGTSGSSSDLGSVSISDSELPPELRSDGARPRLRRRRKATTAKPPTKGIVIQEKRTREGVPVVEIGGPDSSKGKEAAPPPAPKRFQVKPRGDQCQGPAAGRGPLPLVAMWDLSPCRMLLWLGGCSQGQEHLHEIDFQMARADSAELELVKTQNQALKAENKLAELTKELAIEDFKASGEFKAAVTDSAATYFSEGFEFCKRQLLHEFPNLGVDVANMAMDRVLPRKRSGERRRRSSCRSCS